MGLDMYLYAEKYYSPSDWRDEQNKSDFAKILEMSEVSKYISSEYPSATLMVKVAQWRKSNQIHAWFVNNCQSGDDDCRLAYVDRAQLNELLEACKSVHNDHALAKELLPCSQGFFFGSDEYDEYYFNDIDHTIKIIETCLTMPPEWEFRYQASW